ncbi:hypothetical protein [Shinella sp.]|uniref:hypothetical protein n=1 Tax=Shinella sp. TaxID=1870904 RepID=UPI0039E6A1FD
MGILENALERLREWHRRRAEREALRLLLARRDRRLLRDAGLKLIETENDIPRCEPLPQTKERRWTAPLIRLLSPSPRKRDEGDAASASPGKSGKEREKPAA